MPFGSMLTPSLLQTGYSPKAADKLLGRTVVFCWADYTLGLITANRSPCA